MNQNDIKALNELKMLSIEIINKAKKTKVVKMHKVSKSKKGKKVVYNCPCCDGNNHNCVYYVHNENRHMTEIEIADFEYWEGHYIDENGNVHEK